MQAFRLCSASGSAGRGVNYNSQTVAATVKINSFIICAVPLYLSVLFCFFLCVPVCMKPLLFHRSSGPQKCSACIKEDIFEEPTSILKKGCVSIHFIIQNNLNRRKIALKYFFSNDSPSKKN